MSEFSVTAIVYWFFKVLFIKAEPYTIFSFFRRHLLSNNDRTEKRRHKKYVKMALNIQSPGQRPMPNFHSGLKS